MMISGDNTTDTTIGGRTTSSIEATHPVRSATGDGGSGSAAVVPNMASCGGITIENPPSPPFDPLSGATVAAGTVVVVDVAGIVVVVELSGTVVVVDVPGIVVVVELSGTRKPSQVSEPWPNRAMTSSPIYPTSFARRSPASTGLRSRSETVRAWATRIANSQSTSSAKPPS